MGLIFQRLDGLAFPPRTPPVSSNRSCAGFPGAPERRRNRQNPLSSSARSPTSPSTPSWPSSPGTPCAYCAWRPAPPRGGCAALAVLVSAALRRQRRVSPVFLPIAQRDRARCADRHRRGASRRLLLLAACRRLRRRSAGHSLARIDLEHLIQPRNLENLVTLSRMAIERKLAAVRLDTLHRIDERRQPRAIDVTDPAQVQVDAR